MVVADVSRLMRQRSEARRRGRVVPHGEEGV
jgi:hypothetical protein